RPLELLLSHCCLVFLRHVGPGRLGAHDRDRTGDLVLTKNVLYLLSYVGIAPEPEKGIEPPTRALHKRRSTFELLRRALGRAEPLPTWVVKAIIAEPLACARFRRGLSTRPRPRSASRPGRASAA